MSDLPGWHQDIQGALDDPRTRGSLTFALATLSQEGTLPEVRHIGLRELQVFSEATSSGGERSGCRLIFTTDYRTPKVQELLAHPECSMTTWVPELLLQIRIKAVAKIVHPGGADEEWESYRKTLFDSDTMRDRIRAWHANPAPGLKWDSIEDVHKENWMMALGVPDQTASPDTRRRYDDALSNFALMVFTPHEVDVVRMVATGFDSRMHWKRSSEGQWENTKLVP